MLLSNANVCNCGNLLNSLGTNSILLLDTRRTFNKFNSNTQDGNIVKRLSSIHNRSKVALNVFNSAGKSVNKLLPTFNSSMGELDSASIPFKFVKPLAYRDNILKFVNLETFFG